MEKVELYRKIVQDVLTEYGQLLSAGTTDDTEVQMIFDTLRDHYQLVRVGFHKQQRRHGCIFHADIKNGKIWLQVDNTDLGIGNEFLARGVPKSDLVLGFYTPAMREFSEFAVA